LASWSLFSISKSSSCASDSRLMLRMTPRASSVAASSCSTAFTVTPMSQLQVGPIKFRFAFINGIRNERSLLCIMLDPFDFSTPITR
jgi:hypothetical protein